MEDDRDKLELISQFSSVTGLDPERSRFYLESAAWNCDSAVANFYENEDESDVVMEHQQMMEHQHVRPPTPPKSSEAPHQHGKQPSKPPVKPSKFGTISTLRSDEGSSSEEEGQAFYAGGSERGGGQQIIGPKKKADSNSIVSDLFKSAKEHGAESVESHASSSGAKKPSAFQGRAYRLGDTESQSEVVDMQSSSNVAVAQVDVVLKFWQNGFSLDDGPLREFTDPANKEFLDDIKSGSVPRELTRLSRGNEVNLTMEDHRTEDYVKPKKAVQSFSGHGYRLGNPTDPSTGAASASMHPAGVPSAAASKNLESDAAASIKIDSSLPTASLQIRFPDGSRLVAKFNHTHRVAEVRNYVITARPEFSATNFVFMTTFPNKELNDESLTLSQANLINAVLVLKLK